MQLVSCLPVANYQSDSDPFTVCDGSSAVSVSALKYRRNSADDVSPLPLGQAEVRDIYFYPTKHIF